MNNSGDLHFIPTSWSAQDEQFNLSINYSASKYWWKAYQRDRYGNKDNGSTDTFAEAVRAANNSRLALGAVQEQVIGKWRRIRSGVVEHWQSELGLNSDITGEVDQVMDEDGGIEKGWQWSVEGAVGTEASREAAMGRAECVADAMTKVLSTEDE